MTINTTTITAPTGVIQNVLLCFHAYMYQHSRLPLCHLQRNHHILCHHIVGDIKGWILTRHNFMLQTNPSLNLHVLHVDLDVDLLCIAADFTFCNAKVEIGIKIRM